MFIKLNQENANFIRKIDVIVDAKKDIDAKIIFGVIKLKERIFSAFKSTASSMSFPKILLLII